MATDIDVTPPTGANCPDEGWASRKLWLAVFAMVLMAGLGLAACAPALAGLAANLPTVIGGILGALGVFAGANVAVKASTAKHAASVARAQARAQAPADPKAG